MASAQNLGFLTYDQQTLTWLYKSHSIVLRLCARLTWHNQLWQPLEAGTLSANLKISPTDTFTLFQAFSEDVAGKLTPRLICNCKSWSPSYSIELGFWSCTCLETIVHGGSEKRKMMNQGDIRGKNKNTVHMRHTSPLLVHLSKLEVQRCL